MASVDVFLTDMADFGDFNAVYQKYFSGHKPARAVVVVKALPKGGVLRSSVWPAGRLPESADYLIEVLV